VHHRYNKVNIGKSFIIYKRENHTSLAILSSLTIFSKFLLYYFLSFYCFIETKTVLAAYERCLASGDMEGLATLRNAIEVSYNIQYQL